MSTKKYNPVPRRFRYPTGHVAAILYRCLTSPTIRTLAPSLNRLMIRSRAHADPPPTQVLLEFTPGAGWNSGKVYEWYKKQPTTTFTSLEYWKEKQGVQHEFIVVALSNGKYCRFDRAAAEATRGLAPLEEGTTSKDTAHILGAKPETNGTTRVELLLSLEFPDGEDLSLILAACYCIKTHAQAGSYNLYLYNCYFFSWTITCIAARRAVDWGGVTRSEEPWASIVETSLKQLVPHVRNRSKFSSGISKLGKIVGYKPKADTLNDLLEGTPGSKEERFRELLRGPLNNLRPATEKPIQKLLLRSQLAPTLEKHIDEHVAKGATDVTQLSAARAAGAMAMQELSVLYPSNMTDLSYGGFKWDDHCNLAWEAAYIAAAAAAAAPPDRWSEEWDAAWQRHWDEKTASGDIEANRPVGQRASGEAKTAWRDEWNRIDSVRQEHLPAIVNSMQRGLLEHIHDLDDRRLRLGDRASATKRLLGDLQALGRNQASQPPLQDYIRMRIENHCSRVENFGFRSYEDALGTIEEAMHQIWVQTLTVLDGEGDRRSDIS